MGHLVGSCILCPLIVFCTSHSHGLYCHYHWFSWYLDNSFSYICLLSCHYNMLDCLFGTDSGGLCIINMSLMRLPCTYLALLRLSILHLPNACCLSLSLWDFLLLTPCSVSCLIKDNTSLWLCVHILLCVNISLYSVCACLYIQGWCTLVDYICNAYWLHYIQKIGHAS